MRRFAFATLVLVACTSAEPVEPPASPPAVASTPVPIAVVPVARPLVAPHREPSTTPVDPPRPVGPTSDPKCAEAASLWAAGADEMAADRPDQAREQWLRLVRDFPSCPEVAHAFLGFAEHFFAKGDVGSAKKSYEKVAQYPDVELRAWARYKIAWCELNLGDANAALASFVAAAKEAGAGNPPPRLARLRDVALRDSVFAFAEVADPKKAADFYRHLGGHHAPALLARLAEQYRVKGDEASAAIVCPSAEVCTPVQPPQRP